MNNEIKQGIDLWDSIASTLNTIVKEDKEIRIDDKRIWDGYLHRWTNEEWMAVIGAMCELNNLYPEMFKPYHVDALEQAILAMSNGDGNSRILDKKKNKGIEWKMIMAMREVWNQAQDTYLPNQPSTSNKRKPGNNFNGIFRIDDDNDLN